jgi:uncharacterized protein YndB with AHSA1/START domain
VAAPGSAQPRPIAAPPDVIVSRQLHAPRALVWQAWTDPAHIVKWWGPHRFTTPRAEVDLRPGGAVRFEMQAPNGRIYPTTGTVDEVVPPERLVFTTRLERDGIVTLEVQQTVTFEDRGEDTRVTLRAHVLHATEAAATPLAGMNEGWNETFDKMVSYATTTAADREIVVTRRFRAPIDTVWEAWTSPKHLEKWWGPIGFTTTTSVFDFKPGGQWVHTMHGPDGTDYPNQITFREIVPGRRLSYSHTGAGDEEPVLEFEVSAVFERDEAGTRVTWRMTLASAADRRRVIDRFGAYEGAQQTLDRLADLLQVP